MTAFGNLEIKLGAEVRQCALEKMTVTIGRTGDNDIVLVDRLISRHHARLEWVNGALFIIDLGSANGTKVRENDIQPNVPHRLDEGDNISIGDYVLTVHLPSERPSIFFDIRCGDVTRQHTMAQSTVTVGRAGDSDIVLNDQLTSRHHARFDWAHGTLSVTDMGSGNGTKVNGVELRRDVSHSLEEGDIIEIGNSIVTVCFGRVAIPPETPAIKKDTPAMQKLELKGRTSLTIGRHQESDLVLSHPAVSRRHARIARQDHKADYVIEDLGSTNGTYVNGERLTRPRVLMTGDIVHIGPFRLTYTPDTILPADESRDLRLDALHLKKFVSKGSNLLADITLSVKPREFVAIVGVTGAGKSTLLNALSGFHTASQGRVLINGNDLYSNFDAYRTQIGYVPQKNIIHMELTVYEALDYSARLRLPADTTPSERHRRIMEVLETLELTECKDRVVRNLSGGEQKRVSIGVELLTEPGLFFLDEATSGLDPATESQIMRLLRKLSNAGHTIMIVTHATKNVMECDQVIFLAKGGNLAYYGPPRQALAYFGVKDFDEIYEKLMHEKSPAEWAKLYLKSEQYNKSIASRAHEYGAEPTAVSSRGIAYLQPGARLKRISSMRQFIILSRRNLNVLIRDKTSLILMLMMAPIIGTLDFIFWQRGLFAADGGDATKAVTNLFLSAIICFLVGALSSMREIVKETDIYRRERMVTLKILPYTVAKVWVALLVALYSAAIFTLFLKLAGNWPPPESILPVYITLALAIMAGALMGLLISALSPNQNVTPLLLLLFLVPQIIFGGIMPSGQLGKTGQIISKGMTTNWAFESLVTISGMGDCVAKDSCWKLPKEQRDALTEEDKTEKCSCMGPNLFSRCSFPGILNYYTPEVNTPEPPQPLSPGDPPPKPGEPPTRPGGLQENTYSPEWEQYQKDMDAYQIKMEQYGKDIEAYRGKMERYQDDMKVWQDAYRNWKENRSKAIGQAEAIIQRMYDDYGHAFGVSIARNWNVLLLIMVFLFGLLLTVMRLQDRK